MNDNNPLEGISRKDFEYIERFNKRPIGMPFDQFKKIQNLINRLDKQRKGKLVFNSKNYKQKTKGETYKRTNDSRKN